MDQPNAKEPIFEDAVAANDTAGTPDQAPAWLTTLITGAYVWFMTSMTMSFVGGFLLAALFVGLAAVVCFVLYLFGLIG